MAVKLGMKVDLCMGMVVSMTLTLLQGHSGSAEEQIQLWIISTTKQTKIKHAAMVGYDKFYFSLKSSVPVILNYGHTSLSLKTYIIIYTESGQSIPAFRASFWCSDERSNFTII